MLFDTSENISNITYSLIRSGYHIAHIYLCVCVSSLHCVALMRLCDATSCNHILHEPRVFPYGITDCNMPILEIAISHCPTVLCLAYTLPASDLICRGLAIGGSPFSLKPAFDFLRCDFLHKAF